MSVDIWVGERYLTSLPRVLILGESVYGPNTERLAAYLQRWIKKENNVRDQTFARVFNAFSGTHTSRAENSERQAFWDGVVFYNFVVGTVGLTRRDRPSAEQYLRSCEPWRKVLSEYAPCGVIILGKEQAKYSEEIVAENRAVCEVAPHPAGWGVRTEELTSKWNALRRKLAAVDGVRKVA